MAQQDDNTKDQNNSQDDSQGHPAWQSAIDSVTSDLPPEIKAILEPKLQEQFKSWDDGVNGKLQEYQQRYDPYKPLVENNVPLESIQQAIWLAQQLEQNPEHITEEIIKHYKLADKFSAGTPDIDDGDEEDEWDGDDLTKHPAFLALQEELEELRNAGREDQEQEEAASRLEQYLSGLHGTHGEFNDYFVTALMANGIEAEDAIEVYQNTVKTEAEKLAEALGGGKTSEDKPPVVMGGAGNVGSGIPDNPVKMGELGKNATIDLVTQMLEAAARSDSTGT